MPKELREAACGTREGLWLQELDHRDLSSIALWAVCVRARACVWALVYTWVSFVVGAQAAVFQVCI